MRSGCTEPPWAQMDPGIVEAVRALWAVGLVPTDSGDGTSKPVEHDGVLRIPHVFCSTSLTTMVNDADRALTALQALGEDWNVEATYSPVDRQVILIATRQMHGD